MFHRIKTFDHIRISFVIFRGSIIILSILFFDMINKKIKIRKIINSLIKLIIKLIHYIGFSDIKDFLAVSIKIILREIIEDIKNFGGKSVQFFNSFDQRS